MAETRLSTLDKQNEFQGQLKTECHEALQKAQSQLQQQTGKGRSEALYQCALNVIIGMPCSGKSQCFASSEIIFKTQSAKHASYVKTHVSHNAVYLEASGSLLEPGHESAWPAIAKSIAHYRPEKPIDSLTVVIDIAELTQALGNCNAIPAFDALAASLTALANEQNHPIPTYVLLTHTDRIAGFSEFFSELTSQQRQQAWGIIMPDFHHTESAPMMTVFQKRYQNFLRRLNQQQIPRLHATRNAAKRCIINEFPVQIEQLYASCESLINILFTPHSRAYCRGLFFTSAKQSSEQEHMVEAMMSSRFALTIHPDSGTDKIDRPYFIHDIFNKIIPIDYTQSYGHQEHLTRQYTLRQVALVATGVVSTLLVGTLVLGYWQARDYVTRTEQGLEKISLVSKEISGQPLSEMIPELINLHNAQASILNSHIPALVRFPSNHANILLASGTANESSRLLNELLPRLVQLTEKQLADTTIPPAERYHALKAYLMLATGDKIDRHYLEKYLVSLIDSPDPKKKEILQKDLGYLLTQIDLKPNRKLFHWEVIKENRKLLTLLPRDYLGYEILRAELNNAGKDYKNPVFGNFRIPTEFTHEGFATLIQSKLSNISAELTRSQWVFDELSLGSRAPSQQKMADSILDVYSKKYIEWWTGFSRSFTPQNIRNLQDAEKIFAGLGRKHSSLSQVLDVISENTQMMPGNRVGAQLFNQYIAPKLSAFATLDQQYLPQITQLFKQIENDLHEINTSADPEFTIFTKTKLRFTAPYASTPLGRLFASANQYPFPINQILLSTAGPTWDLMMQESMSYLNKVWFDQVYNEYHTYIINQYPVNKTAKSEIPLNRFTHFFSSQGSLQTFFANNISAFLDTSHAEWRLKEVDGLSLPLTQDMVDQLERANIIREMYFGHNAKNPEAHFTLRTHELSPTFSAVAIDVYGQRAMDYSGSTKSTTLQWPNESAHPQVNIKTYDESGKENDLSFIGEWALFRAIDKAAVTRDGDGRHFLLKFAFKPEGEVVYELTADRDLNPFVPDVISQFVISHRLTA